MLRLEGGNGYWLERQTSVELETGSTLLVAGSLQGRVRASLLNETTLHFFQAVPSRLTGLVSTGEQDFFRQAIAVREYAFQIFPMDHPVALKMREAVRTPGNLPAGLSSRLALLQIFAGAFGKELTAPAPQREAPDAKERLRAIIQNNPPDALLEIPFSELARTTGCTPRHLSRIFYELTGISFRDKRAEIRLGKARELLANSKSKVVEVALESGYKSLSLFNLMFTRRFGTSPGRWRQKNLAVTIETGSRRNGTTGRAVVI